MQSKYARKKPHTYSNETMLSNLNKYVPFGNTQPYWPVPTRTCHHRTCTHVTHKHTSYIHTHHSHTLIQFYKRNVNNFQINVDYQVIILVSHYISTCNLYVIFKNYILNNAYGLGQCNITVEGWP